MTARTKTVIWMAISFETKKKEAAPQIIINESKIILESLLYRKAIEIYGFVKPL